MELDDFNIEIVRASIPTKKLLEMRPKQLENTKNVNR